MTSRNIKTASLAAVVSLVCLPAMAASIENKDAEAQTLIITEDGVKNEVVIGAGETVNVCGGGCFVTMPNGDRAALSGGETVQISGGAAIIN